MTDDTLDPSDEQVEEAAESEAYEAQYETQEESAGGDNRPRRSLLRSTGARVAIAIILLCVVAIVVGLIIYSSTRAQRGQQLQVDVYPGAALMGKSTTSNSDVQTYGTKADFKTVYGFYDQKITAADGSGCQKVYLGKVQSEDPGQVAGKCYILNAFQDANQFLSVSIQTLMTKDGKPDRTVIVIERSWKG